MICDKFHQIIEHSTTSKDYIVQRRLRLLNNGKFNFKHPFLLCRCWPYPHNDASTSSLLQYDHQLTERKMMSKLGRKFIRQDPSRGCHGKIISMFQQCPFTDLHCKYYCITLGGNCSNQHGRSQVNGNITEIQFIASVCSSNTLARICIATITAKPC